MSGNIQHELRLFKEKTLNVEAIRESPLHLGFKVMDCVSPGRIS